MHVAGLLYKRQTCNRFTNDPCSTNQPSLLYSQIFQPLSIYVCVYINFCINNIQRLTIWRSPWIRNFFQAAGLIFNSFLNLLCTHRRKDPGSCFLLGLAKQFLSLILKLMIIPKSFSIL